MNKKKLSGLKILLKLINYTWCASPATFVALMISSLLMSCLSFLEIVVIERLVAGAVSVSNGADIVFIYRPMLMLLGILVLYPIAEWLEFMVRGYFWRRGSGYMKYLYHKRIDSMQTIEFENTNNIDELQKSNLGSEDAPNGLRIIIQIMFLYIPYVLSILIYLISIKPMLSLTVLLIFIPALLLELIRMKQNFNFEDKIANVRRKTKYFEDCLVSREYIKDTLLNGSFKYFYGLFNNANKEFSKAFMSMKKYMLKTSVLMKLINVIGYIGVLVLLVYYVYKGSITVSLFAAIYYSIARITAMLKRAISDIGEALVGISNTSFLVNFIEANNSTANTKIVSKAQDISLQNVCFTYPNSTAQALKNINLTIKAGSSLAIVGENGSGKSTLTKIIMGIYAPTSGAVKYGEEQIDKCSNASKFIGTSAVFQDFIKYKLSVEDNIRIGDLSSTQTVDNAIKNADVNLSDLHINLDTALSREFGGQDLSGGQWQRIAIARGLYRQHDLIILDEPTAAIDPIEEANVFDSFKRISDGKTSIFVTHRLGSTKIADRIIVLNNGEIVEDGTHNELMDLKGSYYQLLQAQAQWYER